MRSIAIIRAWSFHCSNNYSTMIRQYLHTTMIQLLFYNITVYDVLVSQKKERNQAKELKVAGK